MLLLLRATLNPSLDRIDLGLGKRHAWGHKGRLAMENGGETALCRISGDDDLPFLVTLHDGIIGRDIEPVRRASAMVAAFAALENRLNIGKLGSFRLGRGRLMRLLLNAKRSAGKEENAGGEETEFLHACSLASQTFFWVRLFLTDKSLTPTRWQEPRDGP